MNPIPRSIPRKTLGLAVALMLAACGGGGGGGGSTESTGTGNPSTPTGTGTVAPPANTTVRLRGVAAVGAPVTGASVRVIDGSGKLVGSTSTNPADGSYTLTFEASAAPLLLQVVGTDGSGQPLILHSALTTLAASAVLHTTPLTDAAVALALGAEPRTVFAPGSTPAASLAPLANLPAAADLLKTIVKSNLADAKTGDAKKLDLFADPAFAANKTGVDLALETLTLGYAQSAQGATQLQLGNKLGGTPAEVTVELSTAAAELAKTGGVPANAISSTTKVTSSPTTVMANLGSLDELGASLNRLLVEAAASGNSQSMLGLLSRAGLLGRYTQQDGARASVVAQRLAGFAARGMQVGRLQVTGCADEPLVRNACTRVAVAAKVTDASGQNTDHLVDVVSFDTRTTPKWGLIGNGHPADLAARSVAWRALRADGSAADATASALWLGIQIGVGASAQAATVQTPGGHALRLEPCERSGLCFASGSSDLRDNAAGSAPYRVLAADVVFRGVNAWLGAADVAAAARYRASLQAADGSLATRTATLRGAFAGAPAVERLPTLDDIGPGRPLKAAALSATTTLGWSRWAATQPDMRVMLLRAEYSANGSEPHVVDHSPRPGTSTSLELSVADLPSGRSWVPSGLWLVAVDAAGRWYHTRYAVE